MSNFKNGLKAFSPTKMPGLKKGIGMADVLNAIRTTAGIDYATRVPTATKNNIAQVGKAILNYQPNTNVFIQQLINRIGLVVIKNKLYQNPLKEFKKGFLEMGDTIEEIFVNMAKAKGYTLEPTAGNEADLFKISRPDVNVRYHSINREDVYPQTITRLELRKAFTSYDKLEDFISKIFESMYSGANFDEFLLMKQLMSAYAKAGKFREIKVSAITTEATAKDFVVSLQENSKLMTYINTENNAANVQNYVDLQDQIILIKPGTLAKVNVEVLALAFNLDKADFLARVVEVDNFGTDMDNTLAIVVDKEWFMIYDTYFEMTDIWNPQHLYWNYFLHVHQILSVSEFAPAIRFITEDPTPSVTSVSIIPGKAEMEVGTTKQFEVEVDVLNGAAKTVTYKIENSSSATSATKVENGLVTIGSDETSKELFLVVTSTVDTDVSDRALITISE